MPPATKGWRGMMRLAAGLGFLIFLFLPGPPAGGRWPVLEPRLPVEALLLAAAAALPSLAGRSLSATARAALALLTLLLAATGLIQAEAPALMGRDLDFAADLDHVGSVIDLFLAAAGPLQVALAGAVAILAPVLLFTLVMLSFGAIERSVAGSRTRLGLLLGITALAA